MNVGVPGSKAAGRAIRFKSALPSVACGLSASIAHALAHGRVIYCYRQHSRMYYCLIIEYRPMSREVIISISIFLSVGTTAQTFPFPDSAAMWVQYLEFMVTQPPFPQFETQSISNICFNGSDTLISGAMYTKIDQCNSNYIGAIREDSTAIYFVPRDSSEAFVLYDFSVEEGDTIQNVLTDDGLAFHGLSAPPYSPVLIDYVVIGVGVVEDRIVVEVQEVATPSTQQIWIEGFGSMYGLFSRYDPNLNVSGYRGGIWCMSHMDTTWEYTAWDILYHAGINCSPQYLGMIESHDHVLSAFPNPVSTHLSLSGLADNDQVTITDLLGRAVSAVMMNDGQINVSHLPAGSYLIRSITKEGRSLGRFQKE